MTLRTLRRALSFCALAVVLVATGARPHASGSLTFPVTIDTRPGLTQDRVEVLGDSFIEGYGNQPGIGGGFLSYLGMRVQGAAVHAHDAPGLSARPNRTTRDPNAYLIPWIQDGKSGTGIADVDANVNARVIAHNPTLIIYLVSQNDFSGTSPSNYALWLSHATSAFNAIDAALPAVRVVIISNFSGGSEQWTAGGWDQAVGNNAQVTTINSIAKTWTLGRDQNRYIWLNFRGDAITDANTFLNLESTLNTPAPGASLGVLLDSTTHPVKGFGYYTIGNTLLSYFNVLTN